MHVAADEAVRALGRHGVYHHALSGSQYQTPPDGHLRVGGSMYNAGFSPGKY